MHEINAVNKMPTNYRKKTYEDYHFVCHYLLLSIIIAIRQLGGRRVYLLPVVGTHKT